MAGEGAVADLARSSEVVGHGPSHSGVLAHTTAYREGGAWPTRCRPTSRRMGPVGRTAAMHLPGARWDGGTGTFPAWIDCRALGLGDDPAAAFLDRGRVSVNSGLPFDHGEGHVRLNSGTTPEI